MFFSGRFVRNAIFSRLISARFLAKEVRPPNISAVTPHRLIYDNSHNRNAIRAKERQRARGKKIERSLPQLMVCSEILWPSVIQALKNWIAVRYIIRPYFDNDFYIKDFVYGAKRALHVISLYLANGEFKPLEGLVTPEVLKKIEPIVRKFSVAQRQEVGVNEDDIYWCFPYQIVLLYDDTNEEEHRVWVEITMVFHILRGLGKMREYADGLPRNIGTSPEYQEKAVVCNYRFIKEFTRGNQSDWTVNSLNHFKILDLLRECNL